MFFPHSAMKKKPRTLKKMPEAKTEKVLWGSIKSIYFCRSETFYSNFGLFYFMIYISLNCNERSFQNRK